MAKFAGLIGFATTVETEPGIWTNELVDKNYVGDVIQTSFRYQNGDKINDDIVMNKRISVIADLFLNENVHTIKYVKYLGVKWIITNIDVQYPRIILTLGGVFNG